MNQKTAYALKKQVQLKNTKRKLHELDKGELTPKKKKNLVSQMKNLIKWNGRKVHSIKRKRVRQAV